MSPRKGHGIEVLRMGPEQRDALGCIVTFSDDRSRWFPDKDALADAVAYADRRGLRIRTISNPQTIYRDIQGSREGRNQGGSGFVYFPEQRMLARIGRADLLE